MTDAAAERRERVLAALVAAGAGGVSGEALAEELECSRAAVHRHVDALRRDGLAIASAHDGYRLAPDADAVWPLIVAPRLEAPLAGPVTWLRETGSTNEGHALLVSVLLRPGVPPVDAGLLPLVVAVGAADALAAEAAEDVRIIWPNDILIGGRKVAGILCEMSADQDRVAWAVAGIGINVRSA
ncbi:MAG: HTH domain-containing protein, partial [Thermoleophilia bacterium]|nr:HTH domain-containing protein [Thermoleophilia bacterium]